VPRTNEAQLPPILVASLQNSLACSACHRRPSLRSASSTHRRGYAFVSGPCEEHRGRRIPHRHFTDRPLVVAAGIRALIR